MTTVQPTHLIVPGSLVIWGTFDKPCARMMAFVVSQREVIEQTGLRQSLNKLRYVAARPRHPKFNDEREVPTGNLQPIEHFGVDWHDTHQDGAIIVLKSNDQPVVARYNDGKPRPWQGHMLVAVAPDLWDMIDERQAYGSPKAF